MTDKHMATTKADALKILRSFGPNTRFYLHVALDAQLPANPEHYVPGGFCASVRISRDTACRFVTDAFTEGMEKRGAALPISVHVGARKSKWDHEKGNFVEYGAPRKMVWIG